MPRRRRNAVFPLQIRGSGSSSGTAAGLIRQARGARPSAGSTAAGAVVLDTAQTVTVSVALTGATFGSGVLPFNGRFRTGRALPTPFGWCRSVLHRP